MPTPAEDPWKKETELFRPFHWGPNLVLLDIWVWSTTFFEKDKIWLVLIIGVDNKAIKYKIKFCRQSWSYYFANFWCFTIFFFFFFFFFLQFFFFFFFFFFHHKWNEAWLFVINTVYTSCRTTSPLEFFTWKLFHMKTRVRPKYPLRGCSHPKHTNPRACISPPAAMSSTLIFAYPYFRQFHNFWLLSQN